VLKSRVLAAALAAALVGAAPLPTVYTAPAGNRPAGASNPARPYDVILPNGRIVAPVGRSVLVGMNALSVALAPGGRYAIVGNDDEREGGAQSRLQPLVHGGYSLTVVDTGTMRVVDSYSNKDLTLFLGLVALKDPANPQQTLVVAAGGGSNTVRFFHLDAAGHLSGEDSSRLMPMPAQPQYANENRAFPGGITVSGDHRTAYVLNNLANSVTAIDLVNRSVLHTVDVGFFPWAAAISRGRLIVTDRGLMRYGKRSQPSRTPPFANVPFTPGQSSAISTVSLANDGDLDALQSSTPMDIAPDGLNTVGGASPGAIAVSKNGDYAYVCMTNVDRIAVVDLRGTPHVVGGLELRLFDRAPYGTQPDALTLSPNGKILYVALAGMNAIAVIDARNPVKLHRLGLIPTGWYPSALTISPNARYLYVANAKGLEHEPGFRGGPPYVESPAGHIYQAEQDSNTIWATLQRIDLHGLPLEKTTYSTLRYNRTAVRASADALVPPLRSLQRSSLIKHVVLILEENKTYDSMLGDLTDKQGQSEGGDPALVSFGADVTPNLHALAREFAVATNFYADADESDAGHQFIAGGAATAYSEKTLLVKRGREPLVNKNEDPEDYPRAGYIFNSAARGGLSYRDYGDLIRVSGYDEGRDRNPRADDPDFVNSADQNAPTSGLGGLYSLDVPALGALAGHIDEDYPGWNLRIRDVRRAKEFIRDFTAYKEKSGMPDFTYIWLPSDHGGSGADIPPLPEEVADGDRALGAIVDYLTHQPEWSSTAIFITPDDAQSSRDHVNEHRSYAIVVSPFAKRRFAGETHLSTVSILKTEEELLGLPPLALGDLLATDMARFFTPAADTTPFTAIPVPTQTASAEGRRIAALLQKTDQSGPDADVERSSRLVDLSRRADALARRRTAMSAREYAAEQEALFQAALRVLAMNGKE
jgi:YVTN family beta-propeller protein